MARRRTLSGDQVHLVVAIEIYLVLGAGEIFAGLQLFIDVGIAGGRHKSGKPVKPGENSILNLACRNLAWPAEDRRAAETTFQRRAFAACEWSLSTIWPREVLCAVVGGEHQDGVVVNAHLLQLLHHRTDDIVELRHSGFFDGPTILGCAQSLVLRR